MTLPDERYRAVAIARDLLARLINPKLTPRVPVEVRIEARNCLRHFPSEWEMQETANLAPRMFQTEMEPLYKMIKQYENDIEK
jgi:hypothetical protein